MSMGSLSEDEDDFNPSINTTPLVDVMLVLLIIFIITIPVINHNVKIDLPKASSTQEEIKSENIQLSIDDNGQIKWNNVDITEEQLTEHIAEAVKKKPLPELHLYAAAKTPYEKVAKVMSAAQTGGLTKMGFVTNPQE